MKALLFCCIAGFSLSSFSIRPAQAQPYTFDTFVGSAANPGSADGTNSSAQFTSPTGLSADAAGTTYVVDGNSIRSIIVSGTNRVVRTLAGLIGSHTFADGMNGAARFNYPQGVAVDTGGNLYVADTYNNAIRKVTPIGTNWVVTTIAGSAPPLNPFGSNDGTNNASRFHNPYGVAVDSATNVYVADSLNNTIRRITPIGADWVVSTLAGHAGSSGSANGSNDVALFSSPAALAVDGSGRIYVADFGNSTVRKITQIGTNWAVTTIAGSPGVPGSADGVGSSALFNSPQCIAVDAMQNLFVTDSGNYTVRKITPAGVVTTLAGSPGVPGAGDGTGNAARFNQPYGIAVDGNGVLYVADYLSYAIRRGQLAAVLQGRLVGKALVLSWPSGLSGFEPESRGSLTNGPWTAVPTNAIVLSAQYFFLTNDAGQGNAFYRLRKQVP